MKTISQVAELAGVSTRTLQYYDEIGLLNPSELSPSGYRLYDDEAMQTLQQILFFRELGFRLKEIKEMLEDPDFDKISTFKKQKELLLLKRNRTDRLIQLLDRLEKGEQCMSFKEFDLSDYIEALENFKNTNAGDITTHWGNTETFDLFIEKIREHEADIAKLAIKEFGSTEKYTEAMKYNLEHFTEVMNQQLSLIPEEMKQNDLFAKLSLLREKEVSSEEAQNLVRQIIAQAQENAPAELVGDRKKYCDTIIGVYSGDYIKTIFDTQNGEGASDFIVQAFSYFADNI